MATYVNDLRLKEIATGDESGTWGTSTNTNLELVAEAFSFGTEAITTNADTHTTTIADGATDPGRSIFLKYTGTLDSTCTITIGPNTVSKLWLIENATSGSQSIVISQGSGASITIANGQTKAIYSDGAGSGAAMVDAFQDLSVPDLFVDDDLTFTSDSAVISFGADADTTLTHTDGSGLTLNSTNKIMFNDASQFIQGSSNAVLSLGATDEIDLTATAIDVNGTMDVSGNATLGGTLGVTGAVTANAGVVIDNITIDGTEIDLSSGDLTVDVAGDIILDAAGDNILIKDAGTHYGNLTMSSNNLLIEAVISDGDLIFRGNDGGATITALTLDMSAAGAATFNDKITAVGTSVFTNLDISGDIDVDGTTNLDVVDIDGAVDMASTLTLAGNADFNGDLDVDGTTNLDVVDIDGAVDMATTLTLAGNADFNGDLDVDGTTNLDVVDIDGAVDMASTLKVGDDTGIGGTAVSGFRLDVIDSGATQARIRSTANSDVTQFFFSNGTTATQNIYFGDTGNTAAAGIRYFHNGDNLTFTGKGAGTEMARFNSSGQLGINTSSPAYTLDVDSTIHIGNDGGSGFSHSRLIFDSGTTSRDAGNFFHNKGDDVEYFAGSPYNKTDSFAICRNATASHADGTANITNALVVVDGAGNVMLGTSTTPTSSAGNLVLTNGTAPAGSASNGVVLYAEDVSSSSELKVRDEAGNVTTLSPHNFELIPEGPSEDMAWSYFSEKDGKRINVDMLKAIRVLEKMSGEKLVFEN